MKQGKRKYSLTAQYRLPSLNFVKVLSVALCVSSEGAALVLPYLRPEAIPLYTLPDNSTVNVRVLFDALVAHYKKCDTVTGAPSVVEQYLYERASLGEISEHEADLAADFLWSAWTDHYKPITDFLGTCRAAADVLREYESRRALEELTTAQATRASKDEFGQLATKLTDVQSIGHSTIAQSSGLSTFVTEVKAMNEFGADRLGCGIPEIDAAMDGGPMRGEFGFWLAGAKVGKSMALVQNAAYAVMQGYNVLVITLELRDTLWKARLLSAITSVPNKFIITPEGADKAQSRINMLLSTRKVGKFHIMQLPGHDTTVADVIAAFKRTQQEHGVRFDVLVIDYADKLLPSRHSKDNEYIQMRTVYEKLRLFCSDNRLWGWTASQAQRIEAGKMPSYTNVADSVHKLRVVDFVIGLSRTDTSKSANKTKDGDGPVLTVKDSKISCKVLAVRNGDSEGVEADGLTNGFEYGHLTLGAIDIALAKMANNDTGVAILDPDTDL